MPKKTMYEGVNNSPQTATTAQVAATAQSIPVLDTAVFPPAPNLCTLGTGDGAEVVQYNAISDGALTGCVRGFGGTTAKIWPADTVAYRAFTLQDYSALCGNIDALFAEKLNADADASGTTAEFAAATTRANLAPGETLSVLMGKIAKWYADLKDVAWSGQYSDLTGAPASLPPNAHASAHAAGGADAVTPQSIGAAPGEHAHALSEIDGLNAALSSLASASTVRSAVLAASGWEGSAAPYTQTVSVAGMTAQAHALVDYEHSQDAQAEEARAKSWWRVTRLEQAQGTITALCLEEKPEADLTLKILMLG